MEELWAARQVHTIGTMLQPRKWVMPPAAFIVFLLLFASLWYRRNAPRSTGDETRYGASTELSSHLEFRSGLLVFTDRDARVAIEVPLSWHFARSEADLITARSARGDCEIAFMNSAGQPSGNSVAMSQQIAAIIASSRGERVRSSQPETLGGMEALRVSAVGKEQGATETLVVVPRGASVFVASWQDNQGPACEPQIAKVLDGVRFW
jgi:hypothetical protein